MRFLMVDKICELEEGKRARGIKNISWDDFFLEEIFSGLPVYSAVIATEAVAQLVSWVIVKARDFTVKPVITMLDSYKCFGHIQPGDRLEIEGEVESMSQDGALAHGSIRIGGRTIVTLEHAVCYLYPLAELDPPEKARAQFDNLYNPGHAQPERQAACMAPLMREDVGLTPIVWVDRFEDTSVPGRLTGVKNVTATEDFFNDHFPLKPVLPGVITIKTLVSAARKVVECRLEETGMSGVKPVLRVSSKTKFRSFVQPGDQMVIEAAEKNFSADSSTVKTTASVDGKTVAMILFEFEHCTRESYLKGFLRT